MIIYSRWDPSSGDYDYFETDQRPGINDDLPVPQLPAATQLGVPSTDCGRQLPPGAVHVGSGELAVGMMAFPADVDHLGATGTVLSGSGWLTFLGAGALGVGLGFMLGRWR